jgi:Zn-dependent peptidase ImmA (M78 family)
LRVTAPAADAAQQAAIDQAIAAWRAVGLTAPDRNATGAVAVSVVFQGASPASYGLYDGEGAQILINDQLTADQMAVVIAHELGHAFGLVHVAPAERTSVMNPGNLTIAPTSADADAIAAIWGCQ